MQGLVNGKKVGTRVRLAKIESKSGDPTKLRIVEGWASPNPKLGERYTVQQDNGRIYLTGIIKNLLPNGFETDRSRYKVDTFAKESKKLRDRVYAGIDKTLNPRPVTIKCMDGVTISGYVNLKWENRVSDLFTHGKEAFIVVFDAAVKGDKGRVILINKCNISSVYLED